jgi:xanthine dehydrogenase YagS FAD-binding subunit
MVPTGENRYHAILGNEGPAYFVNPSSFAPALIAFGAQLTIFGSQGERKVPVAEFFQSPGSEAEKEYRLAADELVTEIVVPPATELRSATYEVRQREALDWPLVAAAVALGMEGSSVSSARIVLGHVAPIPWVADRAAGSLAGKEISVQTAEAAGQLAIQEARPLSRNAYKVTLAQVAVKRALMRAAGKEA